MNSNGFQRISLDFIGFQWISMDSNEFQWISLDSIGFQWIPMNSNGFQWISKDFIGFQWISMGFNGTISCGSDLASQPWPLRRDFFIFVNCFYFLTSTSAAVRALLPPAGPPTHPGATSSRPHSSDRKKHLWVCALCYGVHSIW